MAPPLVLLRFGFSDLHLASGAVINFANGEITLTETDANTLTFAGGIFALPASGFSINGTTVSSTGTPAELSQCSNRHNGYCEYKRSLFYLTYTYHTPS